MARARGGNAGDATAGRSQPRDKISRLEALSTASLEELKSAYPEEWQRTGEALVAALAPGQAVGAAKFLARVRAEAAPWRARLAGSGQNPRVIAAALPVLVRERMAQLAVKEVVDGVAAVRASGKPPAAITPQTLRFGRLSGTLVQALLFRRGLERKPVSLSWFRALWPLVTQKALLMPLVEPRGIYCFYSRPLITSLARLITELPGPAVELAAGDGTLARFLHAAGAPVHATDDHSWSHSIDFPTEVERLDAESALTRHNPAVVICSWPPPGNSFERRIFRTPSVRRYIVLTTRHRFAAGSWPAYDEAAATFDRRLDEALSRLVLPPEIDPAVLVFDRRA